MATQKHPEYNVLNYPRFVCHHGNWDIWANGNGRCAAIPSPSGEAAGCNATMFGDMQYVQITLRKELAEAAAEAAAVRAFAVALATEVPAHA